MEATILAYESKYYDDLLALFGLNSPSYFAPEELKDFKNYLKNEREDYFILKVADSVIGCGGINYKEGGSIGLISWDILEPNYHGNGLGTYLLQHRLRHLKKNKDIKNIIVRTSQLTYSFYEKNGFKIKNIIKDYWASGFDLYLMNYHSID